MYYKVIERFRKRKEEISKFIHISATSVYNGWGPKRLIDGNKNTIYHSADGNNSYVLLVFRYPIYADKLITVSARNRDPRYWVFEGSNDGMNFVELKKNDGDSLCGSWEYFNVGYKGCLSNVEKEHELKNKGFYSIFRLRIYGVSSDDDEYFIVLSEIKIIGKIDTTCYFHTHHRCRLNRGELTQTFHF